MVTAKLLARTLQNIEARKKLTPAQRSTAARLIPRKLVNVNLKTGKPSLTPKGKRFAKVTREAGFK